MKKSKIIFLFMAITMLLKLYPGYACLDCLKEYKNEYDTQSDLIEDILETDTGHKMLTLVEELGGKIDMSAKKTISLPNIEAVFIPDGENEEVKIGLLYLDIKNRGQFILVTESSIDIMNPTKSYVKLYTASGKTVVFQNFQISIIDSGYSFQEKDDIKNLISFPDMFNTLTSEEVCAILLILCIVTLLSCYWWLQLCVL